MNSETDKPKKLPADAKKIESWAGFTRFTAGMFALMFIGSSRILVGAA